MSSEKFLKEAMTASELAEAQAEHFAINDYVRMNLGKLTLEQKGKVAEFIHDLLPK